MKRLCILLAGSILATVVLAGPAAADTAPEPEPAPAPIHTDDDMAVVEEFTLTGELVGRRAFASGDGEVPVPANFEHHGPTGADPTALAEITAADEATGGALTPLGSGSGGSSSSSGCRTVTVNNEEETALGFTAYWFHTWTHWRRTRSTYRTYSIQTGWYLSDVDPNFIWREMLVDNRWHYSWISGRSTSGYYHDKQGPIENCVFHYGCVGNNYPHNWLWSHSNGTWSWQTAG